MNNLMQHEQTKANTYSHLIMILTSLHHLYGSIIYKTPWRSHVLFLSVPVIFLVFILNRALRKKSRSYLFWANWTIILLASILFIGSYEGLYNHVLKNILFFSGLNTQCLQRIFPPGMYEMPNDVIFEVTGVAQGLLAIVLIRHFTKLTKAAINKIIPDATIDN